MGSFCEEFKAEFKCSKFNLRYDKKIDFYRLKCCGVPEIVLWCIRLLFTLYSVASILYSLVVNTAAWPVYLTNWSLFMVATSFVWSTTLSALNRQKTRIDVEKTTNQHSNRRRYDIPRHLKIFWIWYNMTLQVSVLIVAMYWPFVFDVAFFETTSSTFSAINNHGVTLTLLIVDFFYNDIPIRYFHVAFSLIMAFVYILQSILYNIASGDYVYSILNWKESPGSAAAYSCIPLIFAFLMQLVLVSFSILKRG